MEKHRCARCDKSFDSYDGLRRHTARIHKITSRDFYVESKLNGIRPKCKCGCGAETNWNEYGEGFRNYCAGHHNRIHNNWGHNPEAIRKSAETRRIQYASGERKVWNDGLTKETNKIVAEIGKKSRKENNPERAKKISESLLGVPKSAIHLEKNAKHWKEYWSSGIHKKEQSNRRMLWMRENDYMVKSKVEDRFKKDFLDEMQILYEEKQFYVRQIKAFYDIKIKNKNVLIEIDGDFWHCKPSTKFEIPKYECQRKNLEKDKIKNEWAFKNGFRLLRFWESDIKENPAKIMKTLLNELEI